ncbi:hypothetical protein V6N13_071488 [Hibiscus sabdariffa]
MEIPTIQKVDRGKRWRRQWRRNFKALCAAFRAISGAAERGKGKRRPNRFVQCPYASETFTGATETAATNDDGVFSLQSYLSDFFWKLEGLKFETPSPDLCSDSRSSRPAHPIGLSPSLEVLGIDT